MLRPLISCELRLSLTEVVNRCRCSLALTLGTCGTYAYLMSVIGICVGLSITLIKFSFFLEKIKHLI